MTLTFHSQQLIDLPSTSDEQAEALFESMKRLVDPQEMGRKYKVLGLCSPQVDPLKVPGFNSDS